MILDKIYSLQEAINEELLLEMANVRACDTGLPYDLWIDSCGVNRTNKHNVPRIKVNVDGNLIPIEISDNPDVPESVKKTGNNVEFKYKAVVLEYVKAYKNILLAHYNQLISDKQALNLLGNIKDAHKATQELELFTNAWPNLRIEFEWNEDELLYEISVVHDNGVLETAYALTNFEFFSKVTELQRKYTCNKMINLGNSFKEE